MQIPGRFNRHILTKHTQLYPIITIGSYENSWSDDVIILSSNKTSMELYSRDGSPDPTIKDTIPILLNMPSINESIDINQRSYKISSMNISLSNAEYNNIRFSDLVKNSNIVNKECRVFWATNTSNILIPLDKVLKDTIEDEPNIEYPFQAFVGRIYKYDHSDEKVSISVEDISLQYLDKELPLSSNWLDDTEDVPKKYRNKPIPMVYGEVDRSPCVIGSNKKVHIDSREIRALVSKTNPSFNESEEGLFIGNDYLNVPTVVEENLNTLFEPEDSENELDALTYAQSVIGEQWKHETATSPVISLGGSYLPDNNVVQCKIFHTPSNIELTAKASANDGLVDILSDQDKKVIVDGNPTTSVNLSLTTSQMHGSDTPPLGCGVSDMDTSIATCGFFNLKIFAKPPAFEDADIIAVKRIKLNGYKLPVGRNFPSQLGNHIVSVFPTNSANSDGSGTDNSNLGYVSDNYGSRLVDDSELVTYGESLRGLVGFPNWFASAGETESDTAGDWIGDLLEGEAPSIFSDLNFSFSGVHSNDSNFPASNHRSEWVRFVDNVTGLDQEVGLYQVQFLGVVGSELNLYDSTQQFHMTGEMNGKLKEISVKTMADVKDILTKRFYAHVRGREIHSSATRNHLPFHILRDIYVTELGYNGEIDYQSPYQDNQGNYYDEPFESDPGHDGGSYKLDFTVDKKIKAKKLIQGISASSPLITRFDNMGKLRFNIIRPYYTIEEGEEIKSSDVISFSYSRTSLDDVKTNITYRYKKDYSTDDYLKTKTFGIDDGVTQIQGVFVTDAEVESELDGVLGFAYEGYDDIKVWVKDCLELYLEATGQSLLNFTTFVNNSPPDTQLINILVNYFGFEVLQSSSAPLMSQLKECGYWYLYNEKLNQSNYSWGDIKTLTAYNKSYYGFDDSTDTELIVADERSDYIRSDITAEIYIKKLLYWYCNQHLIIKARLPLKYISLEVGSIVVFDRVIGDVNPYGINYGKNAFFGGLFSDQYPDYYVGSNVNGQQAFSQLMITSTKKTLEYVEIEAIQMHNLTDTPVVFEPTYGAKTPDAYGRPPINYDPQVTPTFSNGTEIYPTYSYDAGTCGFSSEEWQEDEYSPYVDPTLANETHRIEDEDGNLLGGYIGEGNFAFYTWENARSYWELQQTEPLQPIQQASQINIISSPGNLNGGCIPTYEITRPRLDSIEFKFADQFGQNVNIKEIYPSELIGEQHIYLGHPSYASSSVSLTIKPIVTTYVTTTHISTNIKLIVEKLDEDTGQWSTIHDTGYEEIPPYGSHTFNDLAQTGFFPSDWFEESQQENQWRIKIRWTMSYEEVGQGERDTNETSENIFQTSRISYLVGSVYSEETDEEFNPLEGSEVILETTSGLMLFYKYEHQIEMKIRFNRDLTNYIYNHDYFGFRDLIVGDGSPGNINVNTQIELLIPDNLEESSQLTTLQEIEEDFALLNNAFTLKSMSHGIDPNTGEPFATFNFRYDGDMFWTPSSLEGLLEHINVRIYMQNTSDIFGVYGDLNGDGFINVMDIVQLVNAVLNPNLVEDHYDLTGDGVVNVLDIIVLMNLILG